MDKVTKAVKAFYEAYPYPTGLSEFDPEIEPIRLLGEVCHRSIQDERWQVLEAGCGCGLGLLAAAKRNPQIHFTGADINQLAIDRARQQVAAKDLQNIRFEQVDLMNLEGLQVPEGGFHLIYSFGVLHHLADPIQGLRNLRRLLTPGGVVACMIYGRYGRQPLQRLVDVIQMVTDGSATIEERLRPARLLAEVADSNLFKDTPWEQTAKADEIEFVDRCLHVNEQSYDIDTLWQLLEQAGLRFLRWLRPAEWSVEVLVEHAETRRLLSGLKERDRYRAIERLFYRPRFELLMTHAPDQV